MLGLESRVFDQKASSENLTLAQFSLQVFDAISHGPKESLETAVIYPKEGFSEKIFNLNIPLSFDIASSRTRHLEG